MQCLSGFELHSRWVPLIEVVISQFPPKCKTSNVFLTITWFFSDFIKYLGDVDIRLSLDWVKYLCISWSGKWRFFAYTVASVIQSTLALSDSEETVLDLRVISSSIHLNVFLCEIEVESDEEVHVYCLKSLSVDTTVRKNLNPSVSVSR